MVNGSICKTDYLELTEAVRRMLRHAQFMPGGDYRIKTEFIKELEILTKDKRGD